MSKLENLRQYYTQKGGVHMQVRRFINEQEVSAEELRNYTIPLTAVSVYDTIARVKKRAAEVNQKNNSKIKEESIAI